MIMNPWVVCVSVCLCVCMCICVCVFVCIGVPVCVYMCAYVCVYTCVFGGGTYVCVCDCVSVRLFVCVCMCPYARVVASRGVALRGRGLPAHGYLPVVGLGHWYPLELSFVVAGVQPAKHHHAAILLPAEERRGRARCRRIMAGTV